MVLRKRHSEKTTKLEVLERDLLKILSKFEAGDLSATSDKEDKILSRFDFIFKSYISLLATCHPKPKDGWDKIDVTAKFFAPIVSAVAVVVIAYFLKDSVDLAIREQQLQTTYAEAMRVSLVVLRKPDVGVSEAEAAALSLAAFGRPAIPLLVNELQIGSQHSRIGSVAGLRMLGAMYNQDVCSELGEVLTRKAGQFSWLAHLSAITIMGEVRCHIQQQILVDYKLRLMDMSQRAIVEFQNYVYHDPRPESESLTIIIEKLEEALRSLEH